MAAVSLKFVEEENALSTAETELSKTMQQAHDLEQQKAAERLDLFKLGERQESIRSTIARLEEDAAQRRSQTEEGTRRVVASEAKRQQIILQLLQTRALLAEGYGVSDRLQEEVAQWHEEKSDLRQQRSSFVAEEQKIRRERRELQDRQHADEIRMRELQQSLATMAERIQDEYQLQLAEVAASDASAWERWRRSRPGTQGTRQDEVESAPSASISESSLTIFDDREFSEVRPEIEAHVSRLRRKLKLLGSVNTDSLNDLEQLEQRFLHLSTQLQDLVEAKATLEDIIRRMNQESRRLFAETFQTIRKNFQHLFRKVFGGGEGDIVLEDPEDILECGIEITARPPGKELRSLSLLSGGEKTMTAIAMIMAIFQAKPSPFCILDEVDAALDEANVDRFANVLREFQTTTQFIMITHHKRSMLVADVLYGVTMEESGVSKRMSVRFDDITEDGNFRRSAAA
ncbi:MAG: hypothetical protein B7Z55_02810 [Planctomycetales bacterium 12-60-4]|nr:MAG: hypothetical protein B7Z55_02810 [Planctomycetales bacterium 12-60-4]